jgi:hypothetical protein
MDSGSFFGHYTFDTFDTFDIDNVSREERGERFCHSICGGQVQRKCTMDLSFGTFGYLPKHYGIE